MVRVWAVNCKGFLRALGVIGLRVSKGLGSRCSERNSD